jgi:hypothetical protein
VKKMASCIMRRMLAPDIRPLYINIITRHASLAMVPFFKMLGTRIPPQLLLGTAAPSNMMAFLQRHIPTQVHRGNPAPSNYTVSPYSTNANGDSIGLLFCMASGVHRNTFYSTGLAQSKNAFHFVFNTVDGRVIQLFTHLNGEYCDILFPCNGPVYAHTVEWDMLSALYRKAGTTIYYGSLLEIKEVLHLQKQREDASQRPQQRPNSGAVVSVSSKTPSTMPQLWSSHFRKFNSTRYEV